MMATDPLLKHACEYMLLVDKVKDTAQMWKIYNATTAHRNSYHDFSPVLRYTYLSCHVPVSLSIYSILSTHPLHPCYHDFSPVLR